MFRGTYHPSLHVSDLSRYIIPGAYPEVWIRGQREGGSRPPSLRLPLPSPSRSFPSHPPPLPLLSPLLPLEVGPLNLARGSGGAL